MRARHSLLRLILPVLIASVGCDSSDSTDPGDPPRYVGAVAAANSNNAISAVLSVTATGYDSVYARFWRDSLAPASTPAVGFAGDSVASVPVLGLEPGASYQLEVVMVRAGKQDRARDTVTFQTDTLPTWVPAPGSLGISPLPGFVLLSLPEGAAVINDSGRVVWYRSRAGRVLGSWQVQYNGDITWQGASDTTGFFVHDILGADVGRHACVGRVTRFHDLLVTSDRHRWLMCDEVAVMDLTSIGGVDSAQVTATVVQHLDPGGQLVFEWRSLDHFQLTDLDSALRTGPAVNFTHGNAIELDTDGNVLLSSRSLSEVTKFDAVTGAVIWRMGGSQNQFTFLNDPKGGFVHQHGVRVVAPNRIQFLDNRDVAPSRMVRYTLDPVAKTATLEWEFEDAPTTYASVGGSTQVLQDGGALVSFGPAGRVVEVDPTGVRRWEVSGVEGRYVFRTQRFTSLYIPAQTPFLR